MAAQRQRSWGDGMLGETIWAKTPETHPYPLSAHLLDSWVTAGAVWDHWLRPGLRARIAELVAGGDETFARSLVQRAASLHDVGKANPVFQTQAADGRDLRWRPAQEARLARAGLTVPSPSSRQAVSVNGHPARRHEYVSGLVLGGEVPDRLSLSEHWLVLAVAGHHGRWLQATYTEAEFTSRMMDEGWLSLARQVANEVTAWTGDVNLPPQVDRADAATAVILVSGLVVLADWLASSEAVIGAGRSLIRSGTVPGPGWLEARESDVTATVKDALGWYTDLADPVAQVMQGAPSLRPLQDQARSVSDRQGMWVVAYPTGEGKTEAALLRHAGVPGEGLIFALPTRATTDAMQARLKQVFAGTGNPVLLSHQFAARHSCVTAGALHGTDWYDTPIRRLVAPVVAATCDQVLAGALRGKHAALRLTALANHHVVLDEVHTYDQYQSRLLAELLHWWGATNTRVTLLSATLPDWQQQMFETAYRRGNQETHRTLPYPGSRVITTGRDTTDAPGSVSAPLPDLSVELVRARDPVTVHVDWVRRARGAHSSAHLAVVVNTVDRAIAVAEQVARMGEHVICLHSRFTLADRGRIERELLARLGKDARPGRPVVLVGTQVVEASLDIDVDLLSTDAAPAPSLIQRAGRCRRFRDQSARQARFAGQVPPRVVQVVVPEATTSLPYLSAEINRVVSWLDDHPVVTIPGDVQAFVDDTAFTLDDWVDATSTPEGQAELGESMRRLEAANKSRARISDRLLTPRARTGSLRDLTNRDDTTGMVEDLMGTRFVDRPSGMYLLARPGLVRLMGQDRQACLDAVDLSIPVPSGMIRVLDQAHQATLAEAGMSAWEPRSRLVSLMLPVNPDRLADAGLVYDDVLGLRKAN